jgi:DNA helicase-2/ATP-dependent DNA helicase PcrA
MTIHSAKGLEFKYVFLVNLVDKRFPTIERKEPIEIPDALVKEVTPQGDIHLQEERRLFYVAMTRAKKGLFFTSAKDYGQARLKKPSRFLIEAGIAKDKSLPTEQAGEAPIRQLADKSGKIFNSQVPITTMHNTLYDFLKKVVRSESMSQNQLFPSGNKEKGKTGSLSFEELIEIYKSNWKDEWFEDEKEKQKYFKLGKDSLKIFYDNFIKAKPKIKIIQDEPALEKGFRIKFGDYVFVGKIDRIDEIEKGIEIIDYKTGKPKTKLKPGDKEQLLIYQIAAEKVFGLCPEKLSYHYLDNGTKVSFAATEKDKQGIEEKVKNMIDRIYQSDFKPNPSPFNCKYCDFKNICEFRKL